MVAPTVWAWKPEAGGRDSRASSRPPAGPLSLRAALFRARRAADRLRRPSDRRGRRRPGRRPRVPQSRQWHPERKAPRRSASLPGSRQSEVARPEPGPFRETVAPADGGLSPGLQTVVPTVSVGSRRRFGRRVGRPGLVPAAVTLGDSREYGAFARRTRLAASGTVGAGTGPGPVCRRSSLPRQLGDGDRRAPADQGVTTSTW